MSIFVFCRKPCETVGEDAREKAQTPVSKNFLKMEKNLPLGLCILYIMYVMTGKHLPSLREGVNKASPMNLQDFPSLMEEFTVL